MDIGMSLPTMARGYSRAVQEQWCRGIDDGPFSSVSCGERITFHNPEFMVTLAAASALTARVRVFANLAVVPLHPVPLLAKQLATLDVLSGGRLDLGVGVGGREHDYRAAGVPFQRRHRRLDDAVTELRRIWAGAPPFDGADPVGPAPVQPAGPRLLAGAMGPKALQRATAWADGVTGFSLAADPAEMARANRAALRAWETAGRARPRLVSGCFYALGGDDPRATLKAFTYAYLAIFGEPFARAMTEAVEVAGPDRLHRALEDAEAAGCDEFILVPATVDRSCLDEAAAVITARG
jgi:alkanesulfonate monooxygenase SsuD/methylene tetrahydromethanopterin reductase-like flavin-dependent oxidoreductase (luciferase family)